MDRLSYLPCVALQTAAGQSADQFHPVYLLLGSGLLIIAVTDLLWTTLWVDGGAGPLSSRLTSWTWRCLRRLAPDRPWLLSLSGPLVLVLTLVLWVGLLWAGWTVLFAGGEGALLDTRDPGPISWTERLYFVAYTLFTMGNGDFTPADGPWQVATSLTTASGMLFVTLSVSYVVSVLSAVVHKRSFAGTVLSFGARSEAVVRTAWDGEDLRSIDSALESLSADLCQLAQQHKAYPILHYYHAQRRGDSAAVAVAVFDESLTLIQRGVEGEDRYDAALVERAQSVSHSFLRTLSDAFIEPADAAPPPPDLQRLHVAGVPTVSEQAFEASLAEVSTRRRKLRAVVSADAWSWPPIEE